MGGLSFKAIIAGLAVGYAITALIVFGVVWSFSIDVTMRETVGVFLILILVKEVLRTNGK